MQSYHHRVRHGGLGDGQLPTRSQLLGAQDQPKANTIITTTTFLASEIWLDASARKGFLSTRVVFYVFQSQQEQYS